MDPGCDSSMRSDTRCKVNAIATDIHFWVPIAVLLIGLALLFLIQ